MRAPDAPIGWPSATAPPLTFVLCEVEPRLAAARERDDGERLVHLEEIDVLHGELGAREHLLDRADGRRREPLGRLRVPAVADDARERLELARLDLFAAREHERRRAVVDLRRVRRA